LSRGELVRNAAVLVLVDTSGRAPRVLIGRRHSGMTFMANKVVFPGGRVETADHRLSLPLSLSLAPQTQTALGFGLVACASKTLPRALALAAIRETAEEAGLLLAHASGVTFGAEAVCTRSAGWRPLLNDGQVPAIDQLHYFARAITPPGRSRRFDTRFFLANAKHLAAIPDSGTKPSTDGELDEVDWKSFGQARNTEMAPITRIILDEAEARLDELNNSRMDRPLPYFRTRHGRFIKDWIPAG